MQDIQDFIVLLYTEFHYIFTIRLHQPEANEYLIERHY